MAPAVQLTFALRTSTNVRTVHLIGSWDNYQRQLPLSSLKDDPSAKPGSWKGTFRFQGSQALQLGSRYWYYYIIDGYHVSHDPAKEWTVEKTTGRKLNVLNVPGGPTKPASKTSSITTRAPLTIQTTNISSSRQRVSSPVRGLAQGRPLSPGKLVHPKPQKPYASRNIREADYEVSPIEDLEERFANSRIGGYSPRAHYASSPSELSDSSISSGSDVFSASSSPSSCSSAGPACRCGRYGVTRDGRRVKLDCGGSRCGYGDSSSDSSCSDVDAESSEDEMERNRARIRAKTASGAMAKILSQNGSARSGETKRRQQPIVLDRRPAGSRR